MEHLIERLKANRDSKVAEAGAMLEEAEARGRDLSISDGQRFDTLMADARDLDARIKELNEQEAVEARADVARQRLGDALDSGPEEERGTWLPSLAEYRGVTQGSGDGGYLVPIQHLRTFHDRLRDESVLLSASPLVIDAASDEVHLPKIGASATANWVAEGDEILASKQTFERVTLKPRKVAALTNASNEVLADSSPSVRRVVSYDLTRTLGSKIDAGLLKGDGVGAAPTGLRNAAGVNVTATGGLATLDALADALGRVEAANAKPSAVFATPEQWNAWRSEKDGNSRPLIEPDVQVEAPRSLFGVRVYVTGHLGDEIIVADTRQIAVARRKEVEVAYSEAARFAFDETAIRAIARYDVAVLNAEAVEVLDTTEAA